MIMCKFNYAGKAEDVMRMEKRLTVLAVDSVEARLALADVLAEDVTSAGLARQLADGIVPARVGVARPFWTRRKRSLRGVVCRNRPLIEWWGKLLAPILA